MLSSVGSGSRRQRLTEVAVHQRVESHKLVVVILFHALTDFVQDDLVP